MLDLSPIVIMILCKFFKNIFLKIKIFVHIGSIWLIKDLWELVLMLLNGSNMKKEFIMDAPIIPILH